MSQIDKQRCFQIPKKKLDLFLVSLSVNFTGSYLRVNAAYIFNEETHYDVVVNYYGSYPFVEKELEKFVEQIKGD